MNVVVTGASSGIGRALACEFARSGHPVLATARREERLQELCDLFEQDGCGVITCLALDLTAPGAPQQLFDKAVREFGHVHVLVNAAGMSPYQYFDELSAGHLEQILKLNICALTELCHLFLAHMQAHGESSRVVNVGSVGGYAPLPRFAAYSGSKHYVRVFSNELHYEYRYSNIRVCALHPGGTLTEFPELAGQKVRPFAVRTMLTPEQLAHKAYPAILKGRRVIIPGTIDRLAVLIGKLLPFPWSMRIMEFIYNQNVEAVPPSYPPVPQRGTSGSVMRTKGKETQ